MFRIYCGEVIYQTYGVWRVKGHAPLFATEAAAIAWIDGE